jgi:hypothetical protein
VDSPYRYIPSKQFFGRGARGRIVLLPHNEEVNIEIRNATFGKRCRVYDTTGDECNADIE